MKHDPCALSNPGGEQQLKLLISGAALETVERKLNVERGGRAGLPRGISVTSGLFREMIILQLA